MTARSIGVIAALCTLLAAGFAGSFLLGRQTRDHLTVTGPSMAPTLWGQHATASCPDCRAPQSVHWQPQWRPEKPFRCWNCGHRVPLDRLQVQPADTVYRLPTTTQTAASGSSTPTASNWQVGDLVAINTPSRDQSANLPHTQPWVVKRVAAVAGQTVSVDADGWLQIDSQNAFAGDADGQPLWLPVYDSRYRGSDPPRWRFSAPCPDDAQAEPPYPLVAGGPGLQYHHLSVYQPWQPDVPRDDFSANAAESRMLRPIGELRITFQTAATAPAMLEADFYVGNRHETVRLPVKPGTRSHELETGRLEPANTTADPANNTASPQVPIVLRVVSGSITIDHLVVWRPIRYRMNDWPQQQPPEWAKTAESAPAAMTWQVTVPQHQLFLLGDNVPLSVDSRQWGFIPAEQIVGRIEPVR